MVIYPLEVIPEVGTHVDLEIDVGSPAEIIGSRRLCNLSPGEHVLFHMHKPRQNDLATQMTVRCLWDITAMQHFMYIHEVVAYYAFDMSLTLEAQLARLYDEFHVVYSVSGRNVGVNRYTRTK